MATHDSLRVLGLSKDSKRPDFRPSSPDQSNVGTYNHLPLPVDYNRGVHYASVARHNDKRECLTNWVCLVQLKPTPDRSQPVPNERLWVCRDVRFLLTNPCDGVLGIHALRK
jgi:hypothetical protein